MSETSTGTAMVLFADVVSSTELQASAGDGRYDAVRRAVTTALVAVIVERGGAVVKTMGDGVMATFGSAVDSLLAAEGLGRAAMRAAQAADLDVAVELRVGVSAGDVVHDGDDVHGTPVVEAARLCGAAAPSQVLCSEIVVMLARGHADRLVIEPIGPMELKGLPVPVVVYELRSVRRPASSMPFPAPLSAARQSDLVGRSEVRSLLSQELAVADAGRRQLLAVSGEPGIGKTHLVAEVTAQAHAEGAGVLLGRCIEELVAPFAPWTEIVAAAVEQADDATLHDHVARHGAVLGRLVPALEQRVPDAPVTQPMDPETERRRLADAIDDLLSSWAQDRLVVVVLDDLHWADGASLAVLGHVLRSTRPARLAVVGTYRDTDLDRSHPLASTLADLRRTATVQRHDLGGLRRAEVSDLVTSLAGQVAEPSLVDALLAETAGNPFFVSEVLRHLAESGAYTRVEGRWVADRPLEELGLPQGVREVVGRRLSRLDDTTNKVLAVAAVAGAEFGVDVVELALAGTVDADDLDDAIDAATHSGLIREVDPRSGRYAFSHALIRQTLLDELSGPRRTRLHWRVGDAIAQRHPRDLDAIAYHLAEGVLAGETGQAVDAALAAGDAALGRKVAEQALVQYERALSTLDVVEADDPDRRYKALFGIGLAASIRLETERWTTNMLEAAELALAEGWTERFVDAVAGAALLTDSGGLPHERLFPLLEQGQQLATDDRRRAQLLIAEASTWYARGEMGRSAAVATAAVEAAVASDDPKTVLNVVQMRTALSHGGYPVSDTETDAALVEGMLARMDAEEVDSWLYGSYDQVLETQLVLRALQLGDRDAVDARLAAMAQGQGMIRRFSHSLWSINMADADGRLEDLSSLATEMLTRFPDYGTAQFCHIGTNQNVLFARHGRAAGAELTEQVASALGTAGALVRMEGVLDLAASSRRSEAEAMATQSADLLARRQLGHTTAGVAAFLAEVSAAFGNAGWAVQAQAELRPHQHTMITWAYGWKTIPADLHLGQAALTLGSHDEAIGLMERALVLAEGFRAPALMMRCRPWLSRALRARAAAGDQERADLELALAFATAQQLGHAGWADDLRRQEAFFAANRRSLRS